MCANLFRYSHVCSQFGDRRQPECPSVTAPTNQILVSLTVTCSIYWAMGGGVLGGRLAGVQTKLSAATLNQGRDLPVLTDYRALLGGLIARQYGLTGDRLTKVFPGKTPSDLI